MEKPGCCESFPCLQYLFQPVVAGTKYVVAWFAKWWYWVFRLVGLFELKYECAHNLEGEKDLLKHCLSYLKPTMKWHSTIFAESDAVLYIYRFSGRIEDSNNDILNRSPKGRRMVVVILASRDSYLTQEQILKHINIPNGVVVTLQLETFPTKIADNSFNAAGIKDIDTALTYWNSHDQPLLDSGKTMVRFGPIIYPRQPWTSISARILISNAILTAVCWLGFSVSVVCFFTLCSNGTVVEESQASILSLYVFAAFCIQHPITVLIYVLFCEQRSIVFDKKLLPFAFAFVIIPIVFVLASAFYARNEKCLI